MTETKEWRCAGCGRRLYNKPFFFDRAPFDPDKHLFCNECWQKKKHTRKEVDNDTGRGY